MSEDNVEMAAPSIVKVPPSSAAARVEGVSKRFGATVALAGVDLEVPEESTVFGLLGPNGAGKTTLVRVLTTLLRPDAGRAEVFGRDVVREPAAVRELIGLTGQFAAVDELLTGRENLEMFGRLFHLSRGRGPRGGRPSCSIASTSPTPPIARREPTRAGCAGGSTWPRACSRTPRCCSSTSPRPGSTRAAATRSGARSASSCARGRRCC